MDFPSEKRFKKLFGGISVSDPLKASEVFHTRKNAMSAPKLWKFLKSKNYVKKVLGALNPEI